MANNAPHFDPPLATTNWSRRLLGPALVLLVAAAVWFAPRDPVRCHGVLQRQGQALAHVMLIFVDDRDATAWQPITDEQGRFDTLTDESLTLAPGEYRVTLSPTGNTSMEIPQRYRNLNTTPFKVRLEPGDNLIRWNVTEK